MWSSNTQDERRKLDEGFYENTGKIYRKIDLKIRELYVLLGLSKKEIDKILTDQNKKFY